MLFILGTLLVIFYFNKSKKKVNDNKIVILDPEMQQLADFSVKIAKTPAKQQKGLMFVESLPENEGMLFIFEKDLSRSFWMKNTKIPLDIIFINKDKKISSLSQSAKPCQVDPCQLYFARAQYVLEINGGLAEKYGIKTGDIIQLELVN